MFHCICHTPSHHTHAPKSPLPQAHFYFLPSPFQQHKLQNHLSRSITTTASKHIWRFFCYMTHIILIYDISAQIKTEMVTHTLEACVSATKINCNSFWGLKQICPLIHSHWTSMMATALNTAQSAHTMACWQHTLQRSSSSCLQLSNVLHLPLWLGSVNVVKTVLWLNMKSGSHCNRAVTVTTVTIRSCPTLYIGMNAY